MRRQLDKQWERNWINRHLPPSAIIAASDIGVIGFYTQRFIIDTEGLITPEILGEHRRNSPAKDQEVYQHLEETQPDYLVKFQGVYPSFSKTEFTPIHKSGKLAVYRTPWTRYKRLAAIGSPGGILVRKRIGPFLFPRAACGPVSAAQKAPSVVRVAGDQGL